jgi:lipopolysaccharide transport system ATP-binding protein
MSGRVVIQVENLSKYYRLGTIGSVTLREDIGRWWARVRGRPDPWARVANLPTPAVTHGEGFWALRDVNFEVREGEVLGIIGRNGAGKSTLLKILSRITSPTSGRALIRGRVGSLLEVGTGFHPELTGRENIYLNGAILGMTRIEITRKLDEIIEFAEISKFIDTPVKRYSSGMTVRLAFAVAAHLEPEILIVDEVLAVGDVEFQRKCIGKMKDVAGHGRTILFVSHNLQAVRSLCTKGVVMSRGCAAPVVDADEAVSGYLLGDEVAAKAEWRGSLASKDTEIVLQGMSVRNLHTSSESGPVLSSANPIVVDLTLHLGQYPRGLCIGFDLFGNDGEHVLRSFDTDLNEGLLADMTWPSVVTVRCTLPSGLLNAGTYRVAPRLGLHNVAWLIQSDHLVEFDVQLDHGRTSYWQNINRTSRPGAVAPLLVWEKTQCSPIG